MILDGANIKGIYDIKASVTGSLTKDQLNRLKWVKSNWHGWNAEAKLCTLPGKGLTVKTLYTKYRWSSIKCLIIENVNFRNAIKVFGIALVLHNVLSASAYAMSDDSKDDFYKIL